jgi:hypothetical protein
VVVNLGADARRPEVKKNLGAVNSWPPSWRVHRRRWDCYRESRRRGGKTRTRGRHGDGTTAVSKGRGTAAGRDGVQLTGGGDFYRAMFI